MRWLVFLELLWLATVLAQQEDAEDLFPNECRGQSRSGLGLAKCCSYPWKKILRTSWKNRESFKNCTSSNKNESSGNSGGGKECKVECFFKAAGLLTSDNKLNNQAITAMAPEEEEWKSVFEVAQNSCYAKARGNDNSICKSGAAQFAICMLKETYLNCPEGSWNKRKNPDCEKKKDLLKKCTNQ